MPKTHEGKVALVTGAAQGIGRTIADLLAARGAGVVVADIQQEAAASTAAQIAAHGTRTLGLSANVADGGSVKEMISQAVSTMGRLDILVNNAGITRDNLLVRMKDDEWNAVLNVNLKGAFLCTQAAIRGMSKQRYGRIINIASIVGVMGNAGQANYAASKAGLIGFTKTVAREYAERGVTVNAVAPGFIDTAMTQALPEEARKTLMAQIPMGRLGTVDDVALAVSFLASDDASYVTGQVLHVNGGMYM
ncbi:MAG: 3-oxoacyl-[acyl-carrier-protein] reductase [Nitrospirae bacterium RBG_16_64_22]|nr:MAG: 3-oxoacyl-[acyl-carrier-protein] reductase [Nitrospirae bacterium RBG_16_64_22]